MFGFKKKTEKVDPGQSESVGFFDRLKPRLQEGLHRTRESFTKGLTKLFTGKKSIDAELFDEIEALLLTADVGVDATHSLVHGLQERWAHQQLTDADALFQALQQDMQAILQPVEQPLILPVDFGKPFVILMVGVNGAGKTTTIGKLAHRFLSHGHSVMLAAGDTFRAAAVEQLKTWGERNHVPVIAQHGRADSAAVIFDALQAATARHIDVLIADTAGRLHTQGGLMEELKKVRRVIGKFDATAPHEVLLTIDATTGQNALVQVKQFRDAIGVNGLVVTKLDGTAKGGILLAVAAQTQLPIRFIGIGERVDDLRPFEAAHFVQALLYREPSSP